MGNLIKMEKYQLVHNVFYWCGIVGFLLLGFFNSESYRLEVMGLTGSTHRAAQSLADIFNGMVYDSTFLLIVISCILALILGQEFSCRTVALEVSAGHERRSIFWSKIIVYLIAFNIMALVYPVGGCLREIFYFGIIGEHVVYQLFKAILYSFFLNSATFMLTIWICFTLRSMIKAIGVTAVVVFVMSLYLGYGMMLKLPVSFLTIYQIRAAVTTMDCFQPWAIIVGVIWIAVLMILSWKSFRRCELY